ncbi:MAG: hypothetical protein PF441_06895 [Desulfuromusa sp.]|nr:hypothetical protein [Desulfuromusa sp.]
MSTILIMPVDYQMKLRLKRHDLILEDSSIANAQLGRKKNLHH